MEKNTDLEPAHYYDENGLYVFKKDRPSKVKNMDEAIKQTRIELKKQGLLKLEKALAEKLDIPD